MVYNGERIMVSYGSCIDLFEVYAHSQLAILLGNNNYGTHPLGMLYLIDEFCFQQLIYFLPDFLSKIIIVSVWSLLGWFCCIFHGDSVLTYVRVNPL